MRGWWSKLFNSAPLVAHLLQGERGERAAAKYLQRQGYKVLLRRFRGQHGEIDLVARDGEVLALVEVKTRGDDRFGSAASAVDADKKRHLASCAREYLRLLGNPRIPVRFDVVEVYWPKDASEPQEVRLIRSAFEMNGAVSD